MTQSPDEQAALERLSETFTAKYEDKLKYDEDVKAWFVLIDQHWKKMDSFEQSILLVDPQMIDRTCH